MESPSGSLALDKGLALWTLVVRSQGQQSLKTLAAEVGIPISTARRLIAAFERQGLATRTGRGCYAAGATLTALAHHAEPRAVIARAARPLLARLARTHRATAHLGMLEGDMVTYLAKERGGGPPIFTREREQLEAYCSGLGKVLLGRLDPMARDAYLSGGPFVPLTPQTIVDPAALARELDRVGAQGYAVDAGEIDEAIECLAVPLDCAGLPCALSLSGPPAQIGRYDRAMLLGELRDYARRIAVRTAIKDVESFHG